MSRSRTAFLSGTITDNPLTSGATTINSAGLASLPAISSPDIAVLVLDPTGSAGAPEVVYVTAHTGSATSATISRGQEGSSARQHASGVAWVHGPTLYDFKGWRLEGSNTTEQTTTSTSIVDLVTISGLLIPATQPMRITVASRKSSGAAASGGLGLKLNSTTVFTAAASSYFPGWTSFNQGEYGMTVIDIAPRRTNYLTAKFSSAIQVIGGSFLTGVNSGAGAALPIATITSIVITAISGSASVTIGVQDVLVEVLDT